MNDRAELPLYIDHFVRSGNKIMLSLKGRYIKPRIDRQCNAFRCIYPRAIAWNFENSNEIFPFSPTKLSITGTVCNSLIRVPTFFNRNEPGLTRVSCNEFFLPLSTYPQHLWTVINKQLTGTVRTSGSRSQKILMQHAMHLQKIREAWELRWKLTCK